MAVKKKTVSKKKSAKKMAQTPGLGSRIKKTSKKIVDKVLVKINPQLQEKIDQLVVTLESSKQGRMGDLSFLAGKILVRAQDISRTLQKTAKKGKGSKG